MVKLGNSYLKNSKPLGLAAAGPPLPPVLSLGIADGLPLKVPDRVGSAAGERVYVIFPVAGATTSREPGGRAGMLPLEFAATSRDRYSLADGAVEATATAIATMHGTSFGAARISTGASRSSIPPAGRDDPLGSRIVRRDAGSPSGRPRTDTNRRLHAACRRSLDSARHPPAVAPGRPWVAPPVELRLMEAAEGDVLENQRVQRIRALWKIAQKIRVGEIPFTVRRLPRFPRLFGPPSIFQNA